MSSQPSPRKGGRSAKDGALVVRDRYWALRLKAYLPGDSYSSLERSLYENISVGRRGEGQGYSQPFALSKVAAGTRGLSSDLEVTPQVVKKATALWPESESVYNSCAWQALYPNAWVTRALGRVAGASSDVLDRVFGRQLDSRKLPAMTASQVRRLGRLTHLDAFGLLLFSSTRHGSRGDAAYLADLYVPPVFARLCRYDQSFAAIAAEVAELVAKRYPGVPDLNDPAEQKAFAARSTRARTLKRF